MKAADKAPAAGASQEVEYQEVALTVADLLALLPTRDIDYTDPRIQVALDLEAEKRLRLRGLLGPAACAKLRDKIKKKATTR